MTQESSKKDKNRVPPVKKFTGSTRFSDNALSVNQSSDFEHLDMDVQF